MNYQPYRCLTFVVLIAVVLPLLQPIYVAAQVVPPDIQAYALPGELAVAVEPTLQREGRTYQVYYFTTTEPLQATHVFFHEVTPEFLATRGVTGMLVTADDQLIEDEALIRDIFSLYRAAAYLYERQPPENALGFVDDTFVNELRAITSNPVFIEQQLKGLFSTRWEESAEALRGAMTPQVPSSTALEEFTQQIHRYVETGNSVQQAVDLTLEAARFSNDRSVRQSAADIKRVFASWRPITQQGTIFVDLAGTRMNFANALEVLDLGARLLSLANLQQDRTVWLNDYVRLTSGPAALDADQVRAVGVVTAEARDNWVQRGDIVLQFVRDKAVELGVEMGEQALAQLWVEWSWQQLGKRVAGHLLAGAASAVLLGFSLGNLLYGLDDLFNNFTAGERADEMRRQFYTGRLGLQRHARQEWEAGMPYDGDAAAGYRAAYMLETLSAVQMHRSYADGVEATVRRGLFALINPIAWFRGREWNDAIQDIRNLANQAEREAEGLIGHPAFVDPAVELVKARLANKPGKRLAASAAGFVYDIVLPGERAQLDIQMTNMGVETWTLANTQLVTLDNSYPGEPQSWPISSDVAPGQAASWTVLVPIEGAVGVRQIRFQMQQGSQQFGDVVTGYIFVLPQQLKDAELRIRQQIEEWKAQGQQAVEDLIASIATEIQRALEEEAQKAADELLSQCSGSMLLIGSLLAFGWFLRRRMGS